MVHQLGSEDWLRCLRDAVLQAASRADLKGIAFTSCEVLTGAPAALSSDGIIAWHMVVKDGRLEFSEGLLKDADRTLRLDYSLARQLMRAPLKGAASKAQFAELIEVARASGNIEVHGDVSLVAMVPPLGEIHDQVAQFTA